MGGATGLPLPSLPATRSSATGAGAAVLMMAGGVTFGAATSGTATIGVAGFSTSVAAFGADSGTGVGASAALTGAVAAPAPTDTVRLTVAPPWLAGRAARTSPNNRPALATTRRSRATTSPSPGTPVV